MKAAGIVHALDVIQMKELHLFIKDNLLVVVGDGDMEMKIRRIWRTIQRHLFVS
tara:strand:- start:2378 stop:2539 length:162 start_codon:yes stop_codon:yes gene_type:complete